MKEKLPFPEKLQFFSPGGCLPPGQACLPASPSAQTGETTLLMACEWRRKVAAYEKDRKRKRINQKT